MSATTSSCTCSHPRRREHLVRTFAVAGLLAAPVASGCSCAAEDPEPALLCETKSDCPCGSVGCACAVDGRCSQGSCLEERQTCVLLDDAGMVFVPEGWFWMGCSEGQDTDLLTGPCPVEELPYRRVWLSSYGAVDMAGNVNEWVRDRYQLGVGYAALPDEDPVDSADGELHVIRGGGYQAANFAAGGYTLRSSMRRAGGAGEALTLEFGFRCAKDG